MGPLRGRPDLDLHPPPGRQVQRRHPLRRRRRGGQHAALHEDQPEAFALHGDGHPGGLRAPGGRAQGGRDDGGVRGRRAQSDDGQHHDQLLLGHVPAGRVRRERGLRRAPGDHRAVQAGGLEAGGVPAAGAQRPLLGPQAGGAPDPAAHGGGRQRPRLVAAGPGGGRHRRAGGDPPGAGAAAEGAGGDHGGGRPHLHHPVPGLQLQQAPLRRRPPAPGRGPGHRPGRHRQGPGAGVRHGGEVAPLADQHAVVLGQGDAPLQHGGGAEAGRGGPGREAGGGGPACSPPAPGRRVRTRPPASCCRRSCAPWGWT